MVTIAQGNGSQPEEAVRGVEKEKPSKNRVLLTCIGSGGWIRTSDQLINR